MRWFVSWTSASRYGQEVPEGDEVPRRFEEIDAVMIATRSWFEHIDLDASGSIDRCKVLMSTGARAHTHTQTHIWWERQHRHSRMYCVQHTHTHTFTNTHANTHAFNTHTHAHTDRKELTKEFARIGITASAASSL
jgi:hypothetical protein